MRIKEKEWKPGQENWVDNQKEFQIISGITIEGRVEPIFTEHLSKAKCFTL